MKIKRIARGYYEIVYLGFCFSLSQDCSNLWRLYITNSCFDQVNRLVLARTKKDCISILKNYKFETITSIIGWRFCKEMER